LSTTTTTITDPNNFSGDCSSQIPTTITLNNNDDNSANNQAILDAVEPDKMDVDEAMEIGGDLLYKKKDGAIRISGCNPNGIRVDQFESQIQHSMDQDIDIQCYSETNVNMLLPNVRKSFYDKTQKMDQNSKSTWSSSDIPTDKNFKPGGTGIFTRGRSAGRIKQTGNDNLGRWSYQVLDGKGKRDVLIVSIYQCCKSSNDDGILTAHRQQKMLLGEMQKKDIDPRRNFKRDLTQFIKSQMKKNKHIF